MSYRVMQTLETGEQVCAIGQLSTYEAALDWIDANQDQYPESSFGIEPDIVARFEFEDDFEDVPW